MGTLTTIGWTYKRNAKPVREKEGKKLQMLKKSFLLSSLKDHGLVVIQQGADRAIAQAVSRRFPTATIPVRAQVRLCGICGRQSDTRAGFLRVLQFPPPILIPPTSGADTIGQLVAYVTSELSLTQPQEIKTKRW
jgi:hypothetical protein